MKKFIQIAAALATVGAVSGCVIAPDDGYYNGGPHRDVYRESVHYDNNRVVEPRREPPHVDHWHTGGDWDNDNNNDHHRHCRGDDC